MLPAPPWMTNVNDIKVRIKLLYILVQKWAGNLLVLREAKVEIKINVAKIAGYSR